MLPWLYERNVAVPGWGCIESGVGRCCTVD